MVAPLGRPRAVCRCRPVRGGRAQAAPAQFRMRPGLPSSARPRMDAVRHARRQQRPDRASRGRHTRTPNPSNGGFPDAGNHPRRGQAAPSLPPRAPAPAPRRGVLPADHNDPMVPSPVKLATEDLALIDRLVRRDRTAVSTALLAIAGIGAGEVKRLGVLVRSARPPARRGRRVRSARVEPRRSRATSSERFTERGWPRGLTPSTLGGD